ncbi:MAG: hypothetical protein RLZZ254_922 [Actinomycetota bacterium]|jgi:uncharacterized protein (DUF952 family)/GNAT superfamily N-acetyltransferase
MIVHLITQVELTAAKSAGTIAPESLTTEGFMHCSAPHQALVTATRFYPNRSDLVAVLIEDSKLGDMLRWEPPAHPDGSPALPGEEFFPHLYSALKFDAVRKFLPLSWVGTQYEEVAPLHPFRIVALADHPNLWQQAAEWSFAAWRHEFPQDTIETYLDQYALAANPGERLVEVYAALGASDRLLGLTTLVDDDELPGVIEPGPWIAAVWVDPSSRTVGVGGSLVRHATLRATSLGVRDLYLYTEDQQFWYERKGWQRVRNASLNGLAVTVMTKQLR